MQEPLAIYDTIGGDEPYFRLVENFYAGVEKDTRLRPMYPEDLTEPKRNLALFLIQRTGGHMTYSNERGHPRMRARHAPFPIDMNARNAWMENMTNAVNSTPEFWPFKDELLAFFADFATFMINRHQIET